jgi:hypothetical protein
MGPQHPKSKRVRRSHSVKSLSKTKRSPAGADLAARSIPSLPVHAFHELRSIRDAVVNARNTAATVCIALPNARQRVNDWEMANTLYECTVRVLDEQMKRIKALLGEKQP